MRRGRPQQSPVLFQTVAMVGDGNPSVNVIPAKRLRLGAVARMM